MQFIFAALAAIFGIAAVASLLLYVRERRRAAALASLSEERNMMVALLSHRLRTPLSSIKWHTELLLNQEFGKLKISQLELLDKVNAGVADTIQVLNAFLDVARVERGGVASSHPVMIDVWEHLQRVIDGQRGAMEEKKLTLHASHAQKRLTVYIDPLIFHMIIDTLLSNAILYTHPGGTVTVSAEEHDRDLLVSVTDTGIGIPQPEQKRIFDKFFRGARAKVMSTGGNGLGLYLVKQLVESLGGIISFASEENKGSTFTVVLPQEKEAGA